MNQAFRTTQRLVVSALLLGAVAMAQAGANNTQNTKDTERHSKLSKAAFWRHHSDANKNAKPAQPKAAHVKPAAAKQSQASKTQVKPVSAKQAGSKNEQKQNTTKAASASVKKTTAEPGSAQPKKPTTAQNTPDSQKNSSKQ